MHSIMGLGLLHLIRGRVGRSSRHAYAYLCYRHGKALSEIAQMKGISRQGVHDLAPRRPPPLAGPAAKLHLVEKFLSVKEKISLIDKTLAEWEEDGKDPEEIVKKVRRIADDIIEEL